MPKPPGSDRRRTRSAAAEHAGRAQGRLPNVNESRRTIGTRAPTQANTSPTRPRTRPANRETRLRCSLKPFAGKSSPRSPALARASHPDPRLKIVVSPVRFWASPSAGCGASPAGVIGRLACGAPPRRPLPWLAGASRGRWRGLRPLLVARQPMAPDVGRCLRTVASNLARAVVARRRRRWLAWIHRRGRERDPRHFHREEPSWASDGLQPSCRGRGAR
jgi:hypothetical protein